jgi:hypothetical protein
MPAVVGDSSSKSLTETPAPADPAPNWHADPLGSGRWRWWNGTEWTHRVSDGQESGGPAHAMRPWWRPGWRKMTWVVIVWCVLMAIWIVAAIAGANNSEECAREVNSILSQETCEDARNAGTGIGVIALWFIWFFGFIALSLIWFMTRPKGRECPACGENVTRGMTACPKCSFDFAAAAQTAPAAPAP